LGVVRERGQRADELVHLGLHGGRVNAVVCEESCKGRESARARRIRKAREHMQPPLCGCLAHAKGEVVPSSLQVLLMTMARKYTREASS